MANEARPPATGEGPDDLARPQQDEPATPDEPTTPSGGRHRAAGDGRLVHLPAAARPGSTGPRLDGVDAARGLAVLSMLVAHLSPVGGILDVSEYLTAPLFAVLVGLSMGLALDRPRVAKRRFVVDNALRGLLLVLVGVLLQRAYGQIDVVLPYLGLLVLVTAPLALLLRNLPILTLGLVAAGAVLGPLVVERVRDGLATTPTTGGPLDQLLLWTAAGQNYRLVSFLPMALAGVLLVLLLPRLTGLRVTVGIAAVLLAASAVVHGIGRTTVEGAAPYSGTTAEVVSAILLASGAVVVAVGLVLVRDRVPSTRRVLGAVLSPVLAAGRLALTAYTVQILVLAAISAARDGARDDTWPVFLGTTVVVVAVCWALDRFVGTGPLELLVRAARIPERGRHGGPLSGPRTPSDPPTTDAGAPPAPPRPRPQP